MFIFPHVMALKLSYRISFGVKYVNYYLILSDPLKKRPRKHQNTLRDINWEEKISVRFIVI